MLLQADRVVDLGARFCRHHRAQELHIGARNLHVHHEVGACEAEDQLQLVFAEQGRIDHQAIAFAVHDRQRKRCFVEAVDDLADQVGALVAIEQRGQHLDLEVDAQAPIAELLEYGAEHRVEVAIAVFEGALQLEVVDDAQQGFTQGLARRVVGTVGGRSRGLVVLDVLGGDGGAHEQEFVAEVAAVQQPRGHRVEEGLGQLGLVVVGQQADVVQLDLLPHVGRQCGCGELARQAVAGFIDAQVVELDAFTLGALLAMPVGALEARLGLARGLAEQAVMAVEAIEHCLRDVDGARVGELGEHRALQSRYLP